MNGKVAEVLKVDCYTSLRLKDDGAAYGPAQVVVFGRREVSLGQALLA